MLATAESAMREAQAVSSSIALPAMASYATKNPIIVDNSNFSSTSSRNTPCATPCLRNAPTRSSHGVTTWSTMCWKNLASLDNTMPTRLTSMSLSRTQSTNRCNSCVKCSRVGLGTGSGGIRDGQIHRANSGAAARRHYDIGGKSWFWPHRSAGPPPRWSRR